MPRICVQGQLNMENTWTLISWVTDAMVGHGNWQAADVGTKGGRASRVGTVSRD